MEGLPKDISITSLYFFKTLFSLTRSPLRLSIVLLFPILISLVVILIQNMTLTFIEETYGEDPKPQTYPFPQGDPYLPYYVYGPKTALIDNVSQKLDMRHYTDKKAFDLV